MWHRLVTPSGRSFFFHNGTRARQWEVPEEIAAEYHQQTQEWRRRTHGRDEVVVASYHCRPIGGSQRVDKKRSSWLTPKEIVPYIEAIRSGKPLDEVQKEEEEKAAMAAAEEKAIQDNITSMDNHVSDVQPPAKKQKVQPEVPLDQQQQQFYELLGELQLSAFSMYEKIASNIQHDPRFQVAANERDRRKWFDAFCAKLAESKVTSTTNKKKTPKDSYTELLHAKVKVSTMWEEFSRKNRHDPRFTNIDARSKEKMFFEYQRELKRTEAQRKKDAEITFNELLKQCQIQKDDLWHKVKPLLEKDERYLAIGSSLKCEELFRSYQNSLVISKEEMALRDRERQLRSEQEKLRRDGEVEKKKAFYEDAVRSFRQLLIDTVRHPDTTWDDEYDRLKATSRYDDARNILSREECKELFHSHLKTLQHKIKHSLFSMLDNIMRTTAPDFLGTPTVRDELLTKVRAQAPALSSVPESRTRRFIDEYIEEQLVKIQNEFDDLLNERERLLHYKFTEAEASGKSMEEEEEEVRENKFHVSTAEPTGNALDVSVQHAVAILQNDRRFDVMMGVDEKKAMKMIESWLGSVRRKYLDSKYRLAKGE